MEFTIGQEIIGVLAIAIDRYGKNAQQDMAIEEMSELTKAILKQRRVENDPTHSIRDTLKAQKDVTEEMADVFIMFTQLLMMQDNSSDVIYTIKQKVKRLADRLGIEMPEAKAETPEKDIGLVCTVIAPDGRHIEHEFSSVEELRKQYYNRAYFPDLPDEDDPVTSCELRAVPIYVDCFGDIITLLGIEQETEDEE